LKCLYVLKGNGGVKWTTSACTPFVRIRLAVCYMLKTVPRLNLLSASIILEWLINVLPRYGRHSTFMPSLLHSFITWSLKGSFKNINQIML
jgi:hypothetical protein